MRAMRHVMSVLALLVPAAAAAHVTLETPQAVAGSTYKAVFRVPHGCGNAPTLRFRVQIPEGVTRVKPMPKAGWEITVTRGPLAAPIDDGHGGKITEGIREVTWTGRLPDEHYDEFVMRVSLPHAPDTTVYFPSVQECETGVARWIEIPAAGKSPDDYKEPAPRLKLTPKPQ